MTARLRRLPCAMTVEWRPYPRCLLCVSTRRWVIYLVAPGTFRRSWWPVQWGPLPRRGEAVTGRGVIRRVK